MVALGHHHVGDGDVAVLGFAVVQLADGLHDLSKLMALDLHRRTNT